MKKLHLIVLLVILLPLANATASWNKLDLKYIQQINNESYVAQVTVLRDLEYLKQNNVTKVGDNLVVNMPEMGLDNVNMQIVAIKPYKGIVIHDNNGNTSYKQINEINWDNEKYRPVTATFKRYAKIVNTYTFINPKNHKIIKINSTPNHPFYVVNKHEYIAIDKVVATDQLLLDNADIAYLVCNKINSCGRRYNTDNRPVLVYNFEVYDKHRYYVTQAADIHGILVHNPYTGQKGVTPIEYYQHLKGKNVIHEEDGYVRLKIQKKDLNDVLKAPTDTITPYGPNGRRIHSTIANRFHQLGFSRKGPI